jgi:hypothetical protein
MELSDVKREVLPNGGLRLSSAEATFELRRLCPGALLVKVVGVDTGQFGTSVLDEIAAALNRDGSLELFVDARHAVRAAVKVSDEWTRFFAMQRERLRWVHVLVVSKALRLTVAIAQHLSRTDALIQIYSDPALFESRLSAPSRS